MLVGRDMKGAAGQGTQASSCAQYAWRGCKLGDCAGALRPPSRRYQDNQTPAPSEVYYGIPCFFRDCYGRAYSNHPFQRPLRDERQSIGHPWLRPRWSCPQPHHRHRRLLGLSARRASTTTSDALSRGVSKFHGPPGHRPSRAVLFAERFLP